MNDLKINLETHVLGNRMKKDLVRDAKVKYDPL